jgi:hypothetical protein
MKGGKFLDKLGDYQRLNKHFAPWALLVKAVAAQNDSVEKVGEERPTMTIELWKLMKNQI